MTQRPIAGIDVAKNFSEMVVISPSCQIIARLRIKHQSSSDLKKAADILKKVEKDFAAAPVVVMESTGHYHKILFHYFTKIGLEVVILNPLQSDSIKNISIRKVKNDKIDAFRIAMLYKLNQSNIATLPLETIECLKRLCRQYYHFNDELIAYKNRFMSVVDQIMLNFREVFPDICSKTALAVLEKYPTPEDILNADRNELISVIQQNSHKSYLWACEKYELLYDKAQEFREISISDSANITMLKIYIDIIRTWEKNIQRIIEAIEEIIKENSQTGESILSTIELLQTIPGVGFISAVTILAEVGNFKKFSKPNKLVAYFGVDPSVVQSGQFVGTKNKMSKRGSEILRRVLFCVAFANIRTKRNNQPCNPVLYEYYQRKCEQKPKRVALGAVMRKIVCIIFAVMRNNKPFEFRTPEEHIQKYFSKAAVVNCK